MTRLLLVFVAFALLDATCQLYSAANERSNAQPDRDFWDEVARLLGDTS